MGYSPGFLLKNGQISTLANSSEIDTNSCARSQKSFQEGLGGVSESLERFPGLAKIGHVQNHGLQPRLFAQKRPNFDPCEFIRNRHKQLRKELEIILGGFRRRFREFGAISRTCQNRPCSKPWAIAQAFCSKTAKFRPLRIHPKSTQTVAQGVRNHFKRVQEAFQRVWSDFQDLPKSAMFKTMGYSPGFLLKNGQISTLANSPESTQTVAQGVRNHLWRVQEAFQRVWSDYQDLQKSAMFKPWAIAQAFCSKTAKFRPLRIHPKSTQTVVQGVRNNFRRVQEAFQRVWSDFQDLPKSAMFKSWAIAQAFCSKTAKFRPLRIHPKSTQTVAQGVRNHLRRVQEAFQRVWSDYQDLQKSAMFKPWAIAQAFCSKTAKFRPLRIHPKSTQTFAQGVRNHLRRVQEAFQRVWSDYQDLQNRPCSNHGLQPRLFAQKRPNFDPCEFIRNRHKQSCKELEIFLRGFSRRFREFGAISRTCQNRPCSKPWVIGQAFCSKTAKFRPLRIHPKSTQTVAQGVRNHFRRVQVAFQKVWSDFQHLPKSAMFKTMGYSPGFLLKNGQISTLANSPESTQTVAQGVRNHLWRVQEAFQRVWSDYQDLQKSAMFKPWAIAQAFCSKTAKFRPLRIHPKSTQTVAQGVRNHFRRVQEAFQRVWSDFQDLPKSAMFKTMGYSPGFLLKIGQISTLANSSEIDTNSRARSQKSFQEGLGGVSESLERFPGLAKIGHVQNHGLQPRLFAQKRPNFDPCEFIRNRHKQLRKELEIILRRVQEAFQRVWSDFQDLQKSAMFKPWAIAQAFCSKTAKFRPLRIHPNRHKQLRKELEII